MSGLAKLCKHYGKVIVAGSDGEKTIWVWDEKNDKPVIKAKRNGKK